MVAVSLSLALSLLAVIVTFGGVVVASAVAIVAFVAVGVSSVEGVIGNHRAWFDPAVVVVLF